MSPDGQRWRTSRMSTACCSSFTPRLNAAPEQPVTFGRFDANEPFWRRMASAVFHLASRRRHRAVQRRTAGGTRTDSRERRACRDRSERHEAGAASRDKSGIHMQRLWWRRPMEPRCGARSSAAQRRRWLRPERRSALPPRRQGVCCCVDLQSRERHHPSAPAASTSSQSTTDRQERFSLDRRASNLTSFDWLPTIDTSCSSTPIAARAGTCGSPTRRPDRRPFTATHTNETFLRYLQTVVASHTHPRRLSSTSS